MCGICGFISKKVITEDELRVMNDTMTHRGPDDAGVEIYPGKDGYLVGMAQRRLSILDLSPLGHQPMHSPDKRVTVVYNGEIYNFLELKEELGDYPFISNCDTEVIIAAYLKWGIDCVNRFNGMFAIAICDRKTNNLYLVRDRIGKKPLYYMLNDDGILFASELKPIMASPAFKGTIDRRILARYLHHQYINAPFSIFKEVQKLPPGSILQFHLGTTRIWKYWDIPEVYRAQKKHPVTDYTEAKQELKHLLREAVKRRMISDVPLGTFLSGGYDSSLITALAQDVSDEPVKTFSIGFKVPEFDEAGYARAVAGYLNTDHTELYIDDEEMLKLVDSIAQYYDEPFADSSQIPSMLVCGLAKEKVTVALSGDGGDEFFCGYNAYDKVRQAQLLDVPGAAINLVGQLPAGTKQLVDRMPTKVRIVAKNRPQETKTQVVSELYIRAAHAFVTGKERYDRNYSYSRYLKMVEAGKTELPIKYPQESIYEESNWQMRRMLLDMDTYLPGDILCKMDRASMKYSLEARCPILDPEVMEYSFRIPHKYKYHKGSKKYILKEIAYDFIPRELLERPKTGFGVPLDLWLRGPLREQVIDYADEHFLKAQGIFDAAFVSNYIQNYLVTGDGGRGSGMNHSGLVWSFLVFQQWYHHFMRQEG
ncbi:MAG: asparagine synthase (glutamine-hydrolyzing) [Lachnospiraceae bacterium]|nr:asparagine synthase (glutamine-hydrolyzing) [Lachnospiraceae bacterium]